jgi:hypothetical protein
LGKKTIGEVGLLLQAEPNIWSTFGFNVSDGSWSGVISRGIQPFREVQTIEQYLEIREGIHQTNSKPHSTFTEEPQVDDPSVSESSTIPQVNNVPRIDNFPRSTSSTASQVDSPVGDTNNAALQVDNVQYVPRAFGGTLIMRPKRLCEKAWKAIPHC